MAKVAINFFFKWGGFFKINIFLFLRGTLTIFSKFSKRGGFRSVKEGAG